MSSLQSEWFRAGTPKSQRLMIVLHGLGDSTAGYSWMPDALKLPWLNYLLVNAPDPYYGGFSWFDFMGEPAPGIRRSRKLLFELFDKLEGEGWPTEQTMMFGFSQGALMTMEVGCRYPKRLAGLIGVSGFIFEPETLVRELSPVALQQRFLITHGTMDSLIPMATVRDQVKTLKGAGLAIEWHEFVKEHTIAGQEEVDLIRGFIQACYGEK